MNLNLALLLRNSHSFHTFTNKIIMVIIYRMLSIFWHVVELIPRSIIAWLGFDIAITLHRDNETQISFLSRKQCTASGPAMQEWGRGRQYMVHVTAGPRHGDQGLDAPFRREHAAQPCQLLPGPVKCQLTIAWISKVLETGSSDLQWNISILKSLSSFILLHVDIPLSHIHL